MAYDIQKVLEVAFGEVGYLEKANNSNLDDKTANAGSGNYTKYARDLDALGFFNGRKNGCAWCAVWVCWDFVRAYGVEGAKKLLCLPAKAADNCAAGCKSARNYFKAKGQLHDSPQVGDQVFFYSSDMSSISHTGLVYMVDGNRVYTVEGNTSGASGVIANGGGVCKKSYALSYARLAGFGRPNYGTKTEAKQEAVSKPETATNAEYTLYKVHKGDSLWKIAKAQLKNGNRYVEIKALNGLDSDLIKVGQVLKIPKA